MKRIKLTVAYDGTNYCGWQIQDNGITIEEVLNRELSKLLQDSAGEDQLRVEPAAAGRYPDSGIVPGGG